MEHALFALPVLSGKSAAARGFLQALEGDRQRDYAASEERLGIDKEVWALQQTPMGELFVIFFQGADIGTALGTFVASRDDFDVWFKDQVKDTTGVDLNVAPTGPLSDVLSVYEAEKAVVPV
jgi:hypothetical protein